jgi:Uma2 family endonuclease
MTPTAAAPDRTVYPDSDGKPMADNTLQFQWILTLFQWFDLLFADRPDVFVAGNLFWYPAQGKPKVVAAPDVLVAFGRPKGHRRSYKQWLEGGVAPQVTFEVRSPGNSTKDLDDAFAFYQQHGAEEYYLYDPDREKFRAWRRADGRLAEVPTAGGVTSPRLGVRLACPAGGPLRGFGPDGAVLLNHREIAAAVVAEHERVVRERQRANEEGLRAAAERLRADAETQRADAETRRAEEQKQLAEEQKQRADALAAKLRELGVDPDAV